MTPSSAFARILALTFGLCVAGCGGLMPYHAERTLQASPEATGARTLHARFAHGDLTALGSERGGVAITLDVTVQATTQQIADDVARALEVVSSFEANVLSVRAQPVSVEWPESTWQLFVTSRFELPRAMGLDVATTHGDLDLRGLDGPVRARATHGDAALRDLGGDLDVRTTHGDLAITDVVGEAHELQTTHGDVDVDGLVGHFDIETTHGDVFARLGRLSGRHEIETTHGEVTLELHPDSSLRVSVETSHDRIRSELPGARVDVDDDRAAFTLGGGQGTLDIETSHAAVTLRPRADLEERM